MTIHRVLIASLLPALLGAAITSPALATAERETDTDAWCMTHPARLAATLARHRDHQRQEERERTLAPKAHQPPVNVYPYDQVVVIEDNGTVITPPRPFDLSGRSIQFLHRPRGMGAVRSSVGYSDDVGTRALLSLFGAAHVPFDTGFRFPFYDHVYDGVWVNDKGFVSFEAPELFSSRDNILDFLVGEPAIAAFFADLDPAAAAADGKGGLYVKLMPRRVRISWVRVPERGTDRLVTAQVTLFDTGRILFAYGDVEATTGVVGVFPGLGAQQDAYHLDLDVELPQPPRQAALFESFIGEEQVDEIALVETFYERFQDRYDQLIVWFDFPLSTGDSDGAFQVTFKNDVEGIGVALYDLTRLADLGTRRLESYVQMGYLGNYPDDALTEVVDTHSAMDLLAHQVGHRWLGLVRHRSFAGGNQGAEVLNLMDFPIGKHWSFYFDSDASFLGGNDFRDNGDGTFTTMDATSRYCALDLYLMGLVPAEAVPGFFYLRGGGFDNPPITSVPRIGVTVSDDDFERVDLEMWQVTDAMGARVPSHAEAPDVFNMAFVLLARQGEPPSSASLEKLNYFRRYWHRFFKEATDFHGRVNTTLRPKSE